VLVFSRWFPNSITNKTDIFPKKTHNFDSIAIAFPLFSREFRRGPFENPRVSRRLVSGSFQNRRVNHPLNPTNNPQVPANNPPNPAKSPRLHAINPPSIGNNPTTTRHSSIRPPKPTTTTRQGYFLTLIRLLCSPPWLCREGSGGGSNRDHKRTHERDRMDLVDNSKALNPPCKSLGGEKEFLPQQPVSSSQSSVFIFHSRPSVK
jgi:hypothetical protein